MKLGHYLQELFSDIGSYISSNPKEAAVYTGMGLAFLLSDGCSRDRKEQLPMGGLNVGGKHIIEDTKYGGEKKNYVVLYFIGGPESPPPRASDDYKAVPDVVLATRDSTEAMELVRGLRGRTAVIKNIRPEGFYRTTDGGVRYLAAPGDIEFVCDDPVYAKPCVEKKSPVKKASSVKKTAVSTVTDKKDAPVNQAPVIIEKTVYIERPVRESQKITVNNYYNMQSGPSFHHSYYGRPSFYAYPRMPPRPIVVRRQFRRF
jgi:hypothetical protein